MPCAINRIAGYYREQILLRSSSRPLLQRLLAVARKAGAFSITDRIAVDVDPVSLL
jgi:primosomal protein N'